MCHAQGRRHHPPAVIAAKAGVLCLCRLEGSGEPPARCPDYRRLRQSSRHVETIIATVAIRQLCVGIDAHMQDALPRRNVQLRLGVLSPGFDRDAAVLVRAVGEVDAQCSRHRQLLQAFQRHDQAFGRIIIDVVRFTHAQVELPIVEVPAAPPPGQVLA